MAQRHYPEPVGPKSGTEMMAWLFGLLHGAYSILMQYEEDAEHAEALRMREFLDENFKARKVPEDTFTKGGGEDASEATGQSPL